MMPRVILVTAAMKRPLASANASAIGNVDELTDIATLPPLVIKSPQCSAPPLGMDVMTSLEPLNDFF